MPERLAMRGGLMAVEGAISRYNSIGPADAQAAMKAVSSGPLSGFLGGKLYGGNYVQRLEELWSNQFKISHSIVCNSATSGLLAACAAAGVGPGGEVLTTPFTMSATAAAPAMLGAKVRFGDVDPETFCLKPDASLLSGRERAVIVTNLFGHPAHLRWWKDQADRCGFILIEDNAQGPLAKEGGVYAGCVGHIGVFSLNVHKHLQCGEGGVVVTSNSDLARAVRRYINHGELAGDRLGLNLRMTEPIAAIAISQLARIEILVHGRVAQAAKIMTAVEGGARWFKNARTRQSCAHVYYMLPFLLDLPDSINRASVVEALKAEGFSLDPGYVKPLYHLKAFQDSNGDCPVAEELHNRTLVAFSNCEWSPTERQIEQFGAAVRKVDELMVSDAEKVNV